MKPIILTLASGKAERKIQNSKLKTHELYTLLFSGNITEGRKVFASSKSMRA